MGIRGWNGSEWVRKSGKMRGTREENSYGGYVKRWVTEELKNF